MTHFLTYCFIAISFTLSAQTYRNDVRHRPVFWSEMNVVYKTAGRWSLQFDHQYRRQSADENGRDLNLLRFSLLQVFRPWVSYQLSTPIRLSLSPVGLWWHWGRTNTYRPTTFFQELRVIPQVQITRPVGDGDWIWRFRTELRWPTRTDTLTSAYVFLSDGESSQLLSNRFNVRLRAMTRWINPIAQGGEDKSWYSHLSVEPMVVATGSGVRFDQNRTYVALGRKLRPNIRLELGYLNQFSIQKREYERLRTFRFNHALHVYVYLENRRSSKAASDSGPE